MSENENELYVIKKLETNCEYQITCQECLSYISMHKGSINLFRNTL